MLPFLGVDSVIEPQRGPKRPRLVGEEAHPGPGSPLAVQAEEGTLIGQIGGEDGKLPALAGQADSQVGPPMVAPPVC